ncbi:MAG: Murein DD-endopeptidase MepM [Syntrophorhabdus sp. PtaU1.Bin058]|nr:MAG: Murein DD-endopeptidase MepM [Syntrophorhabdus sp. PtaU1.Bin058]
MKKTLILIVVLSVLVVALGLSLKTGTQHKEDNREQNSYKQIRGTIRDGDTLFTIFKKYKLELNELFEIRDSSAGIHDLSKLCAGRPYRMTIDGNNRVNSFVYFVDDDSFLNVVRSGSGFHTEKVAIDYEVRIRHIGGTIKDNLISSIGEDREDTLLAMEVSDIFSWDIDFTTDIREGDTFRIIAEGMYLNGEFKKYGDILSVEFVNNGELYRAYRFENGGEADYYDPLGRSVRRAFLKAPLNFKRISSYFSKNRFHPILKRHRPHHGVDYAAPRGTPVSATGKGTVVFAGRRGAYGKLVILKHKNGYRTYYGHLSRIAKGVRREVGIDQGQLVGYVGKTGLATGPHLHYEMRVRGGYVNPLGLKQPYEKTIPEKRMAEFMDVTRKMNRDLASIPVSAPVYAKKDL